MDTIGTMGELNSLFNSMADTSDKIIVGSPTALSKFYKKVAEEYNLDELKGILDSEENMLIISGAGSGKTTSLLLKIFRDILAGKLVEKYTQNGVEYTKLRPILISTFLKSGAEELATKFDTMCQEFGIEGVHSSELYFKTIHAEVYSALSYMGVKINIISEQASQSILRDACSSMKISSLSNKQGGRLTNDELGDLGCIISFARNHLDIKRYSHPLMDEYGMTSLELKLILERSKNLRVLQGLQDFEDLEEMLYEAYSKFPNVLEYIKTRYDYVYVDEFQDTSQLQYAILKPYLESAKGFLCIGDDDQTIYSWRGSDIKIITETLEQDFHPAIKQLTVNRRCAENILNSVIPSIEQNSNRHKKKLQASRVGGEIEICVDAPSSVLSEYVKQDIQNENTVGILGRTNADLLIPALLLELDGVSDFTVSKSLSLSDRMPSQVLGVISLITQRYTPEFEGLLKLFVPRYTGYQATKVCDILSVDSKLTLYNIDLEDLRTSAASLYSLLRTLRVKVEKDPIAGYLYLLDILEDEVYNGTTIYAQRARDFIYYIKSIIKTHPKLQGMTILEIEKLFNIDLPERLEKRKVKGSERKKGSDGLWKTVKAQKDTTKIRVTTVHDSKGKEWDSVYIWNDIQGCFPNTVGNRDLTDDEFEEERRVHYIAWTRPKNRLVVFTRSNKKLGFLSECNLEKAKMNKRIVRSVPSQSVVTDVTRQKEEFIRQYIKKYSKAENIAAQEAVLLSKCSVIMGGMNYLHRELLNNPDTDCPIADLEWKIFLLLEYISTGGK